MAKIPDTHALAAQGEADYRDGERTNIPLLLYEMRQWGRGDVLFLAVKRELLRQGHWKALPRGKHDKGKMNGWEKQA